MTIERVGQEVIDRIGIPKDRWEITAQLEVLGYRDSDAKPRFDCNDLFDAADRILALFREGRLSFRVDEDEPEPAIHWFFRVLRRYLDGLMFALPMVLQGATMLLWRYGLWGALDLDLRTGSAIALGFIASYIATSGFAWAIVRRGLFYVYQTEGALARWSALRLWWIAVRVVFALLAPVFLFNLLYGVLPWDMALLAALYYLLLSVFWLNWSLIYLVGRNLSLLAVLAVSIALVIVAVRVLEWPVLAAHVLGLAVADLLTFAVAMAGFNQWTRKGAGKRAVNPPRLTILVYSTAQVFLYGLLYSAFIFMDRILAWTSSRERIDFPPYAFWLSAHYELGMDLALLVIVLLAGVVEYSTHEFSVRLVPAEKRTKGGRVEPFLEEFTRFRRRQVIGFWVAAAVALYVSTLLVDALRLYPDPRIQEVLAADTTMRVFWLAAISYIIFMFALEGILILMTLSRADLAVRAIAVALVVNGVVGFAISRALHYSGAVMGLLAGSVVLAIVVHRSIRAVLRELDYYFYAAY